jgi:hypothetical protein
MSKTATRKTARRTRCTRCKGPTYIWDRFTGERVCIDCTFVRPSDPSVSKLLPRTAAAA